MTRYCVVGVPDMGVRLASQAIHQTPAVLFPCAGMNAYSGVEQDDLFEMDAGVLILKAAGVPCDKIAHVLPLNTNVLNLPAVLRFLSPLFKDRPHPMGLPLLKVLYSTVYLDFDYPWRERMSRVESSDHDFAPTQLPEGFLFVLAVQCASSAICLSSRATTPPPSP
jgi:hypothetical protein